MPTAREPQTGPDEFDVHLRHAQVFGSGPRIAAMSNDEVNPEAWHLLHTIRDSVGAARVTFEIIEQHNDVPSAYRDALAATPGLHVLHVAVWTDDFAKIKADALSNGWVPILESPSGPGESCYVVHPSEPMVCMEISDRSPFKEHGRNVIRDMALSWDGTDPIREGLPQ